MKAVQRPCARCSRPCWGVHCRPCHRVLNASQGRRTALSNNWSERKRRRRCVEEHRKAYGDVCPGWGVPAHAASDLCADHVVPVAAGGDESGPLSVLCRRCNSAKRDRIHPPKNAPVRAVQGASRAW